MANTILLRNTRRGPCIFYGLSRLGNQEQESRIMTNTKDTNHIKFAVAFDFYVDESKVTEPNIYYGKVDGIRLALIQIIKEQLPEKFGVHVNNYIVDAKSDPVTIPTEQAPAAGRVRREQQQAQPTQTPVLDLTTKRCIQCAHSFLQHDAHTNRCKECDCSMFAP